MVPSTDTSVLPQENMKLSLAASKALRYGKQEAVAMQISEGFAFNNQNQFVYNMMQNTSFLRTLTLLRGYDF